MGKASKWLMNLLLGRRELEKGGEKEAVVSVAAPEDYLRSPFGGASPVTAQIKRRWSFGRYKDIVKSHKSCKSMDSGRSSASALELETETQRRKSVDSRVSVPVTSETSRASKAIEHAAATKIQAAFRSYLARKALRALRGLVKLQALVRGHLVRKQTTTTIRRMQALMAIQVRARFQRVQMAPIIAKSQSSSYRSMPHDRGSKRTASRETVDMNLHERCGVLKSARGYQNHTQIERIEQGFTAYHSGDLSISKREHQYQEISFITATHNSPQPLSPTTPKQVPGRASFGHQQQDYSLLPTYMSNTESFRAKARSQSEPKQRPRWNSKTKTKQRPSVDGTSIVLPSNQLPSASSSNLKRIAFESQEPWFVELYRTQRRSKDNECDGGSGIAHSNYRQLLVACEPHATTF